MGGRWEEDWARGGVWMECEMECEKEREIERKWSGRWEGLSFIGAGRAKSDVVAFSVKRVFCATS